MDVFAMVSILASVLAILSVIWKLAGWQAHVDRRFERQDEALKRQDEALKQQDEFLLSLKRDMQVIKKALEHKNAAGTPWWGRFTPGK